jgi:hypothetical protein
LEWYIKCGKLKDGAHGVETCVAAPDHLVTRRWITSASKISAKTGDQRDGIAQAGGLG